MNLITISVQTDLCSQFPLEHFSLRLTWTLFHFLWQGTTIAFAFAVVHRMLRPKSANSRYIASLTAMTMLIVTPAMTFLLSADAAGNMMNRHDRITSLKNGHQEITVANQITPEQISTELATAGTGNGDESTTGSDFRPEGFKEWLKPLSSLVTLIYISGLIVMLLRLAHGLSATRRLIADSAFVSDPKIYQLLRKICDEWSIRVVPLIAQTRDIGSPVVVRILRPLILLPSSVITGLTTEQIEAVLAHELAHIRRRDMLFCVIQRVVETLLFFHPAIWFVSHRMNLERERACDEMVLSLGWKPVDYCEALLRAAEVCTTPLPLTISVMGMSISGNDSSGFKQRIVALLGDQNTESSTGGSGYGGVLAASGLLILTSVFFTQTDTTRPKLARPLTPSASTHPPTMSDESERTRPEFVTRDSIEDFNMDFVHQVLIEGNTTIPTAEIAKHIKCTAGDSVSESQVKDAVDALVRTRWFSSVEPKFRASVQRGIALVFHVTERPLVHRVEFKGCQKVKKQALESMTQLKPGSPFDVSSNRECARRMEEYYHDKGFAFATVELEKGNDQDDRDVVFRINEGPKVHVSSINFVENKEIDDSILKTKTRTGTRILSLFGGKYDPASSKADIEGLKQYYHSLGYFDVDINHRLRTSEDKSSVDIAYEVDEGVRYQIGNIEIEGNQALSEDEIRGLMNITRGIAYNARDINKGVDAIKWKYGAQGRLFCRVDAIPRWTEEKGVVDLVYRIEEDKVYRIRSVNIHISGDHLARTGDLTRPGGLADPKKIHMGPVPIALDFAFPLMESQADIQQVFSFYIGINR